MGIMNVAFVGHDPRTLYSRDPRICCILMALLTRKMSIMHFFLLGVLVIRAKVAT